MKKELLLLTLFGLILPIGVLAQTVEFQNPLTYGTFGELVDAIVNFIFTIALVLAPLMVIIGAFYIMSAAGDAKKVGTGKTIITYTLIGFAVILFAKGLIAMIEQVLGVR